MKKLNKLNKITKIEIIPISIELNEPFVISVGALSTALNTVVIIHTKDQYGTGECCRVRTIFSETQEGVVAIGKKLAPYVVGEDVTSIYTIIEKMDCIHPGHSSIKAAFDMALYDLNAKLVNQPLYQYLHGDSSKKIYTDMTVGLGPKEEMVQKATSFMEKGFPALKIKLGERPATADIKRIEAIRQAVGDKIPIRIDANQGWNYVEASKALLGMKDCNIEYCEAPVHAQYITQRKRLRTVSAIPLMGDECIFSPQDTFHQLSQESIDMVNIKLGKSGGICHAMKIASIAESADVDCQVGCFSETRLGLSALAHFATAWSNIKYFDMDSALMHSDDPIIGGVQYADDWRIMLPESSGHGASFDESFLKRFPKIVFE